MRPLRHLNFIAFIAFNASAGNYYTTPFPATENPISQGNRWTNGLTTGLDWSDVRTTTGKAFGTQVVAGDGFNDSIACLSGTWGSNQIVQITLNQTAVNGFQEMEALLRWHISAHSAYGYECNASIAGQYIQIVRWNGARGSFDYVNSSVPFTGTLVAGDVITFKIVGNIITTYRNGVSQHTDDITSIAGVVHTNGNPGIGFFVSVTASSSNFSITNYTAMDGDPVISADPQNQTVNVGDNATFTVTAGGLTTLSYQWKFNGSNVGSNSSSYTRNNCQLSDNGGSVTCVVTDTAGNVTSGAATLTVNSVVTSASTLTVGTGTIRIGNGKMIFSQ